MSPKPLNPQPTPQENDRTPSGAPTDIILSDEQKDVLRRVENGENVFFTGSAGTTVKPTSLSIR